MRAKTIATGAKSCMMGAVVIAVMMLADAQLVTYAAVATDPLVEKQGYLNQIRMPAAWDISTGNAALTIAMVDTGVDLSHPDLTPNLVEGITLIDPDAPPQDDNGHGTNVAGVIAAAANNERGVAGILWNAKLMPIKALQGDGTGDEAKLGEGILYAVDHGAKIVVMSLGLNKYSSYLSDIVQYAEDHGVLLVAATGNEGNRVKYPAAYPTVLAVGGMAVNKRADERSNSGPEIDLVAPWDVFTTAAGGGYEFKDGTSMAAPQVAAVAALIWAKHPEMQPYEVRSLLRQTSEDLNQKGWDASTGYGLLRADRALIEPYVRDMYEPNNRSSQAKPLSVSKEMHAQFADGLDEDWFLLDIPYDGTVHISPKPEADQLVQVTFTDSIGLEQTFNVRSGESADFQVSQGAGRLQLQLMDKSAASPIAYSLTTGFDIYRDPYEDNDKQYIATELPASTQKITGTFHQMNDQDWYRISMEQSGTLKIKLSPDTARMDPVLWIQKTGEKSVTVDQNGDGEPEYLPTTNVHPGDYYIKVTNVKEYPYPITGQYELTIDYQPKHIDPNEPNDKLYQATTVSDGDVYSGVFSKANDADWFAVKIGEESMVRLHLDGVPDSIQTVMALYDNNQKQLTSLFTKEGQTSADLAVRLVPGTYYIKLTASQPFDYQMYTLEASTEPLTGGFTDIGRHWAKTDIAAAVEKGLIDGYGDYTFRPDQTITRAEAAALLTRAFKLNKVKAIAYSDVAPSHWSYSYIAKAAQAGIVDGYPDLTFAPDKPVTRMEMTAMAARALKLSGKRRGSVPFTDVDDEYWGVGILKQMKAEGWIEGFPDGSYRPEKPATRAEFVTLLADIVD
jgi:hypothetical protein